MLKDIQNFKSTESKAHRPSSFPVSKIRLKIQIRENRMTEKIGCFQKIKGEFHQLHFRRGTKYLIKKFNTWNDVLYLFHL